MSTFGAENTTHDHRDWLIRKETTLRRHKLDCGHPNAGEVFFHAWCDRLTCSGECANAAHDCSAFGGVKSGIEEEPEPVEAVELSPEMTEALVRQPRCADCGRWAGTPAPGCDGCRDRPVPTRFVMNSSPAPFARPHPASPYLTREDITGQRDRINDALRAEVRRQGLDEETIRIEAIRPEGIPAPTWHPITDVAADGTPLTVTMRQARFEPRREIRVLVEGEEVYRGVPEPWPSEMSECPDDSNIATRPGWWQWRPW